MLLKALSVKLNSDEHKMWVGVHSRPADARLVVVLKRVKEMEEV